MRIDVEKEEEASRLRGSLIDFTKFFFKYITQRDFNIVQPDGREPRQITICRELTKITRLENHDENFLINIRPGSGKTLHLCMWVAWSFAHYPDCNFIYVSFSHTLAAAQTAFIKQIMQSDMYKYLFDVELARDSRAKDHFATTAGGHVAAFGSAGSITGRNAGLPNLNRFSGAVIIDDAHKPDESHSDTVRQSVIRNYEETIRQRPRGQNVPIISIGQRVHEDDLSAFLISGKDTKKWNVLILKERDDAGNILCPDLNSKEYIKELETKSPYVYASQFQQDPLPAGGGLFKPEWIVELDFYPEIKKTFLTADTSETSKNYNDATVFSFWGVYEIETMGRKTGITGLHWLDCLEIRIEPKDLKDAFLDFWQECNRFKIPPMMAAIEKKSTGVTLVSALQELRGITVKDINRSRASGSKTDRFLRAQPFVANKQISINRDAKHKQMCLTHIAKITANQSHRFDDIADTLSDAIDIALIEKQIVPVDNVKQDDKKMAALRQGMLKRINARSGQYGDYR